MMDICVPVITKLHLSRLHCSNLAPCVTYKSKPYLTYQGAFLVLVISIRFNKSGLNFGIDPGHIVDTQNPKFSTYFQ